MDDTGFIFTDFVSVENAFTIGATVPTGFEKTASEEVTEKLPISRCVSGQGKVYFQAGIDCLSKIHCLRSVDNLFLVIKQFSNFSYNENKQEAIKDLKTLASDIPWTEVVKFWKENSKHHKILNKQYVRRPIKKNGELHAETSYKNSDSFNGELLHNEDLNHFIRFRASANRIGKKQSITSPDAEWHFGGAIQDHTQWTVDLTNYNFEVLITLGVDFVTVCLSLTNASLHRRNIIDFGYTTLRASIAYNMLRMCDIKPGDVVIDPMCGSGSIPIEAVQEWCCACHVAGDNSSVAVTKSLSNIININEEMKTKSANNVKAPIDVFRWDVRKLPFRDNIVDVFVTDLPFGKRLGSKFDNRLLYPSMLVELARVCKAKTGRACLLTNDKRSINMAISAASNLWVLKRTTFVNIGGLRAAVYLLKRLM